jgi:Tol biopolymer transport system component
LYAGEEDVWIGDTAWSPDGQRLALIESGPAGGFITIIDASTGETTASYQPDPPPRTGLDWARTKDVIAYDSEVPTHNKFLRADIYTLDLADGTVTKIISDGSSPSWSPDDGALAFGGIRVLDFATGETTKLASGGGPCWLRAP